LKRWLRRIFLAFIAASLLLALVICIEVAIGWRCNLRSQVHAYVARLPDPQLATASFKDYSRPEDDTFLSYPEWYIVWSYQEKADFQKDHLPSGFPYLGAVRQYWSSYCCISRLIRGKYPFNGGEQLMLVVIGTSFSAEYLLKGAYEKTIGRLSEWSSNHEATEEDAFAYKVAREYADFVHVRPFYEFHFARQIHGLWSETHLFGPHFLRKWERKSFLTADYTTEAFYCWTIERLTHLSYGFEPTETYAWITNVGPEVLSYSSRIKVIKQVSPSEFLVDIPRYQEFTSVSQNFVVRGVRFVEIAGNSQIIVSVLAPRLWDYGNKDAQELFSSPILTVPGMKRVVMRCEVASLSALVADLQLSGVTFEHIYDY
jgi:hypothetical protein